jgi:spore maturation protein CgeB
MISYDINKIFNQSKILFERTIPITLGTRFFETIGSKGLLLMNRPQQGYNNGIDLVAADGIHYVGYDDTYQDFEYKLDYYLNHPEEREKIATQGYEHFLRNHTYSHRLDTILKDFRLLESSLATYEK